MKNYRKVMRTQLFFRIISLNAYEAKALVNYINKATFFNPNLRLDFDICTLDELKDTLLFTPADDVKQMVYNSDFLENDCRYYIYNHTNYTINSFTRGSDFLVSEVNKIIDIIEVLQGGF